MKPTPNVWKYRLRQPFIYQTRIKPDFRQWQCTEVFFTDDKNRLRLTIGIDGTITIEADYAWDGCSPKWQIGWLQFGVPDGAPTPDTGYPYTYYASLLHDALLQWVGDPRMPFTREQIDLIFREKLTEDKFPATDIYYGAVRLYSRWMGFKRGVFGLRIGL